MIDPREPLQYLSWLGFASVAGVYTALTFRGELFKLDVPRIFSKQNPRPLWLIIAAHVVFLAVLFAMLAGARHLLPALPGWMTVTYNLGPRHGRGSFVDVLLMVAGVALEELERQWLCVEIPTRLPQKRRRGP